jgi:DNA-binding response OmpR family regulator
MTQQKHHILLVEDETTFANPVMTRLEIEGFTYHHATTGEEALKYFFKNPEKIDLVLLDLKLGPGIDGLKVLEEIRNQGHNTFAMILTAHHSEENMKKGDNLSCNGFVKKSAQLTELIIHVNMLMNCKSEKTLSALPGLAPDHDLHDFTFDSQKLELTRLEYRITDILYRNPNTTFDQEEMLVALGMSTYLELGWLATHVSAIRRAITQNSNNRTAIETIRTHVGWGYAYHDSQNN